MARTRHLKLGLVGLLLVACGGGSATPEQPAAPAPVPAAAVKAPATPPTPSIEENTFRLALETEPNYGEGKSGQFRVVLTALGGYHVNPDYPMRVELKAPEALKLAKSSLGKPDAAEFGEHAARFDVSFTAPKGTHSVEANVDFAVCTKETCVPDQRTVAVKLQVM